MKINSMLQKMIESQLSASLITSLTQKNRKLGNTAKKIIEDNVVHEDSEDTANMFNDFVDIRKNIDESLGGNNNNHLYYISQIN